MKKTRMRSATKLAFFSTATIITATLGMYAFLLIAVNDRWFAGNPGILLFLLIALVVVTPVAYVISSLIIDKALNPVRVMIEKVKSVGNRDFSAKIALESSEDELAEYALAFNRMSSKIGEYVEKQKRFISDASHELATPLTVIVGHADMLIRWGKDDPETLADGLATIKAEASAMNSLIENLLFFARSDEQRIAYDKKSIDLAPLLRCCVEEQRLLHPEFSITLSEPASLTVCADPEAIKRVLRILFANSVKYSPDAKRIEATAEKRGQSAVLRVSDSGIGIAPEHLTRVFDRFFRVDDSRARKTGGAGLGLAIAKEILNAHGFSITAQSALGEGTAMIIEMPSSNLHDTALTSS